jgi:hypothetical protein
VSDDRAEFRELAKECLREAEQASNGQDRKYWLNIAEMWTKLAMSGSFFGVAGGQNLRLTGPITPAE